MINNKVYICHTYFHLLISILKSIHERGENTVIVTTASRDRNLYDDARIIKKVKESNIFKDVVFLDDSKANMLFKKIPFAYYFFLRRIAKKYKEYLIQYDSISLFHDGTLIGRVLNVLGLKYDLLEDGINSMSNPQYSPTNKISDRVMRVAKIYRLAQSPNIKHYEVNDASIISESFDKTKIREEPKKSLFRNLSRNEKKEIMGIFGIDKNIIEKKYNILLLTQPFDIDYSAISENLKIELYKKIVEKYGEQKILIKTHPREKTDYEKYFPNCDVISDKFPVELLNFLPVKFKNVVAVSSTAAVYNTGKTTVFGWDWLDRETNGAIYGRK